MTVDAALGWAVLTSLLGAASATLILPVLRPLERALPLPPRLRWPVRGLAIAAGAFALWHVIPLLVQGLARAA
jgi:hypothetical protein